MPDGRGPLPNPDYNPTATATQPPPTKTPRATSTPIDPTPQPLDLSGRSYAVSSLALSMILPVGWEVTSEHDTYIRVENEERKAWIEGAVESSGYELTPLHFAKYVETVMDSLYSSAEDYELVESSQGERDSESISSMTIGGETWYALDVFLQRGKALYTISFHATSRYWRYFLPQFREILASLETSTGYIKEEYVYQFTRPYTAPNGRFMLWVPLSWTIADADAPLEGAAMQTITSPDEEAVVQVITLDAAALLEDSDIGQITISLLKEMEGEGFRVVGNAFLNDGRVYMEWRSQSERIIGSTYFWLLGRELNIINLRRTSDHIIVHQPRLMDIANTYHLLPEEDGQ